MSTRDFKGVRFVATQTSGRSLRSRAASVPAREVRIGARSERSKSRTFALGNGSGSEDEPCRPCPDSPTVGLQREQGPLAPCPPFWGEEDDELPVSVRLPGAARPRTQRAGLPAARTPAPEAGGCTMASGMGGEQASGVQSHGALSACRLCRAVLLSGRSGPTSTATAPAGTAPLTSESRFRSFQR